MFQIQKKSKRCFKLKINQGGLMKLNLIKAGVPNSKIIKTVFKFGKIYLIKSVVTVLRSCPPLYCPGATCPRQACSRLTSRFRVASYCRRVDLECDFPLTLVVNGSLDLAARAIVQQAFFIRLGNNWRC